jgi:hypothetical protein
VRTASLFATYNVDTRTRRSSVRPRTPEIQQSVVQHAERESVRDLVRTTLAVPAHMYGLDGHRMAAEPPVEAAHRAGVRVRPQHLIR